MPKQQSEKHYYAFGSLIPERSGEANCVPCGVLAQAIKSTYASTLDDTWTNSAYMTNITAEFTSRGFTLPAGIDDVADVLALCSLTAQNPESTGEVDMVWDDDADRKRTICPDGSLSFTNDYDQYNYRFGFNGQERDDDVSGVGNTNSAEYWEYDTRIGIRWNRDPIVIASISPYVTFNDNPIYYRDPRGLEGDPPVADEATTQRAWGCRILPTVEVVDKSNQTKEAEKKIDDAIDSYAQSYRRTRDKMLATTLGFGNAWQSNQTFGVNRISPNEFGGDLYDYTRAGQKAGDYFSLFTATGEMFLGAILMGGGGLAYEFGGEAAVEGGIVLWDHGAITLGVTMDNIMAEPEERSDEAHGNPSTNGSKGSSEGNFKKLSSNKDADEFAKLLGYKDAHALKDAYVPKNGSKFDIEIDRTLGKGRLISKDGKTIIDIH